MSERFLTTCEFVYAVLIIALAWYVDFPPGVWP